MTNNPYRSAKLAVTYDRLAVPLQFAAPAKDLVKALGLSSGARVLDVGAGTGAVTTAAATVAGPKGLTVGADASMEMLSVMRRKGPYHALAAEVPHLPFQDEVFDAVLAGFVITHFRDYKRALIDMTRVLRPNGRMGATAWGLAPNPALQTWSQVASLFVDVEDLTKQFHMHIPSGDWFANPDNLREALTAAGLTHVEVLRREYVFKMSVAEYLTLREFSVQGKVLRERIGTQWADFSRQIREALERQFPSRIEYVQDVYMAVASKPAPEGSFVRRPRRKSSRASHVRGYVGAGSATHRARSASIASNRFHNRRPAPLPAPDPPPPCSARR